MPTVEGRFAELDTGVRMHYRDWGGDGPPLVLLHGLSSSSRIWDWTAPLLREHFRVIAVDQRSHGLSSQPEDGYGFDEVTADLDSFLRILGVERPALAGHSWGASVALAHALTRPVSAVALVDGGIVSLAKGATWDEMAPRMRPPAIDGTPVDTFLGFMKRWPNLQGLWSDELGEMVLSNFEVRDGKIYRALAIPNHMKIAKAIFEFDPGAALTQIQAPVLTICCVQEPANEEGRRWQRMREAGLEELRRVKPGARVIVMEDTIHDVPVQRPRELAEHLISFLGN
ncbi:MAG TPA: alpha/beta hydrolase [Dehalococcoidia bacterium]|nr:alpha/beta hydrolase [Dehalococcoidia bacterium]